MTEFNSIGVIGQGFVGTAVREGLRHVFDVVTYDKKEESTLHFFGADKTHAETCVVNGNDMLQKLVAEVNGPVFVCVPTPMKPDGSCDISIVESVLFDLNAAAMELEKIVTVILKSTVPPGTTRKFNTMYRHLKICFNPEFLREASPNEDFANQDRIILGADEYAIEQAVQVFYKAFPSVRICSVASDVAEMIKYVTNVFLATKLSLSNELYQICKPLGIDWEAVWKIAALDKRLSESHWQVPAPDGNGLGWGGSCFPKDLNSMMRVAVDNGVDPKVMRAVWEKNLEVRPERDWEKLIGRAVVE